MKISIEIDGTTWEFYPLESNFDPTFLHPAARDILAAVLETTAKRVAT